MFICEECKNCSDSGDKMNKVPVSYRRVEYPPVTDGSRKVKYPKGLEIVKELKVCNKCVGKFSRGTGISDGGNDGIDWDTVKIVGDVKVIME
jgi:hypothetical protein